MIERIRLDESFPRAHRDRVAREERVRDCGFDFTKLDQKRRDGVVRRRSRERGYMLLNEACAFASNLTDVGEQRSCPPCS
jgi:hypothetical protein